MSKKQAKKSMGKQLKKALNPDKSITKLTDVIDIGYSALVDFVNGDISHVDSLRVLDLVDKGILAPLRLTIDKRLESGAPVFHLLGTTAQEQTHAKKLISAQDYTSLMAEIVKRSKLLPVDKQMDIAEQGLTGIINYLKSVKELGFGDTITADQLGESVAQGCEVIDQFEKEEQSNVAAAGN